MGLARWQHAVAKLAEQTGQEGTPRVAFGSRSKMSYDRRRDTLYIARRFAQRWSPASPQARFLIAHELCHREHQDDFTALYIRGGLSPAPLTAAAGGLALLSVLPSLAPPLPPISVMLWWFSVLGLTPWLCTKLATRRIQPRLHHLEFHADDYATDTVGLTGAYVLSTLTEPTGLGRWARTHPAKQHRLDRQLNRRNDDIGHN